MKRLFTAVLTLIVAVSMAQNEMTSEAWQSDLKHLQNVIHEDYSFLFKKITPEAFDQKVEAFHDAIPEMETHEIVVGFSEIVSAFKYGHTRFPILHEHYALRLLPVNLYDFDDGVYIQGASNTYSDVVGTQLIAVEGVPIKDVMDAVRPVVPTENEQFFRAYGMYYLRSPEVLHAKGITEKLQDEITFTINKDGQQKTVKIKALPQGEHLPMQYGFVQQSETNTDARKPGVTPYYLRELDKIYFFEYLPEQKTVYVRHSQIQDDPAEDIPTFYNRLFEFIDSNEVERLVIDVRLNGGGNNYKNKSIITGLVQSEKINQPGKLFVIIGRRTFSACQNLVNEMSNYTNAIFVGEPTGENINFYGDNRPVVLPNSTIPVYLSFAWWQDKPQWENGPWTAPHLAVDMTFDDYFNNRDPYLKAALEMDGTNFIIDPMRHLTDLFMAGKIEQLKTDVFAMVKDPRYRFFDFEAQFNGVGYNLMNGGQLQEALFVLQMNNQLFPQSPNTYDSLAEVHWKLGKTDQAKSLYEKAITLDPKGATAKHARAKLAEMEKQ